MPLPSSGAISLNQMHVEVGGTSGTQCSINDSDIRGLISKTSGATMSFNEWYGASANLNYLMLSGNSTYVAAGQYNPEQRYIGHTGGSFIFGSGYATAYNRTINGRTTRCNSMFSVLGSAGYQLVLLDISGGAVSGTTNLPANSGWTSVTLENTSTGLTRTYQRSAATVTYGTFSNGGTLYSGGTWRWTNGSNIFPASNNTTNFTVTIN